MGSFVLNGQLWRIVTVSPSDEHLVDRTGSLRVATTDPRTRCIYLSADIHGEFRQRVLAHELTHAVMFSYGLLRDIHSLVEPENWIAAEEWCCNLIADYAPIIFSIMDE